jgi:hypothetical protein
MQNGGRWQPGALLTERVAQRQGGGDARSLRLARRCELGSARFTMSRGSL